jgi:hypothetical protein
MEEHLVLVPVPMAGTHLDLVLVPVPMAGTHLDLVQVPVHQM